jgi:hypothetical protein
MSNPYIKKPAPFFRGNEKLVVVSQADFVGLNVGYECAQWRYEAFSDYIFRWLVEFATPFSDLKQIDHANCLDVVKRAAEAVYTTDNYKRRGEFGELILHAILRELFDTEPIANKFFYKSSVNDTVKGFDSVHARVAEDGSLELWFGEVKFYNNYSQAVKAVVGEIVEHVSSDKLREEFVCVGNIVDRNWEHAEEVLRLFSPNTSLDDVFKVICIPVLLTYESAVVQSAREISDQFLALLRGELTRNHAFFREKLPSIPIKVLLILLPLDNKRRLVEVLDKKLKGLQS